MKKKTKTQKKTQKLNDYYKIIRLNLVFELQSITYFIEYLVVSSSSLFFSYLIHAEFLTPCTV